MREPTHTHAITTQRRNYIELNSLTHKGGKPVTSVMGSPLSPVRAIKANAFPVPLYPETKEVIPSATNHATPQSLCRAALSHR